jgi:hypothetical protein
LSGSGRFVRICFSALTMPETMPVAKF